MSYLIAKSDEGRNIAVSLSQSVEIGRGEKDFTVVVKTIGDMTHLGISDATISRLSHCPQPASGQPASLSLFPRITVLKCVKLSLQKMGDFPT